MNNNKKVMGFESKRGQNEKKHILQFEKMYLLYYFFWLVLWLCVSKVICRPQEGVPITF